MQISPFLMFTGHAEEAMTLYMRLFPESKIVSLERYSASGPGKEGTIKVAEFELAGQRIKCIDSPVTHGFSFTPSVSLFVDCDSDQQQDELFRELSSGGSVLMPLANHGFSRRFAWVQDRFGLSWQINLP